MEQWFTSQQEKEIFYAPNHPDWFWGPPSLLFNGYWGLKLTTEFHIVPMLGMCGAVPPLPSMPS
jgi:hypothetical protein